MSESNMKPFLDFQRVGHVAVLTMNRIETMNALSDDDAIDSLVDACTLINGDESIRAAVLTGSGRAFSAGGNLKTIRNQLGAGLGAPVLSQSAYRKGIQRVPLAFQALEVPVIAAVNGYAIGAGNDLACMCDIRIASEKACFAESFVKLGLSPGDGGAWLLPRAMNRSRAMEMIYTGRMITAQQALEWNLVSQVVSPESLMSCALELGQEIAANPPQALRLTKRLMRESEQSSLATVLEMSAAFQALLHHTDDHEQALRVHLEWPRRGSTGTAISASSDF